MKRGIGNLENRRSRARQGRFQGKVTAAKGRFSVAFGATCGQLRKVLTGVLEVIGTLRARESGGVRRGTGLPGAQPRRQFPGQGARLGQRMGLQGALPIPGCRTGPSGGAGVRVHRFKVIVGIREAHTTPYSRFSFAALAFRSIPEQDRTSQVPACAPHHLSFLQRTRHALHLWFLVCGRNSHRFGITNERVSCGSRKGPGPAAPYL